MTSTATPAPTALLLARGEHWAVYSKPAGMTVVGGRGVPRPTLLDIAIEQLGAAKPVHRLDKRYVAIVEGKPTWTNLVVDARLARVDDPELPRIGGKKAPLSIQTIDENGDRALTRLRVLSSGDGVSLIEARPETGRMHQIRCHLAHVGFPIVGDRLYGATSTFVDGQDLALHAFAVGFPRPEGGRGAVAAALPAAWWAWAAGHKLPLGALGEAMAAFITKSTTPTPAPKPRPSPAASRGGDRHVGGHGQGHQKKKASSSKPSSSKPSSSKATPPSPKPPRGQPQSKSGGAAARSGPSRRGGRPGR